MKYKPVTGTKIDHHGSTVEKGQTPMTDIPHLWRDHVTGRGHYSGTGRDHYPGRGP